MPPGVPATPSASPGPAPQEADGLWLPRGEAARLFARDQQVGLLERDVQAVKDQLAIEQQKTAALLHLVALERQKAAAQGELAAIETQRREAWQARAVEAERKNRFNRVAAGAGTGAAVGSLGGPPGMAVGAFVGALIGYFSGD